MGWVGLWVGCLECSAFLSRHTTNPHRNQTGGTTNRIVSAGGGFALLHLRRDMPVLASFDSCFPFHSFFLPLGSSPTSHSF